ncbi:hypothetical protein L1987_15549 [Smallanthus sonchifolius]|uniref:Uncharacterized protein n=1 Tax=Smallanthus sonchifolius TaxID=185202 RepID=A0ACB9J833_9ASTR|nr:hypothetical protein L1987_15549 [Smallanthus sonchifolius]
MMIQRILTVHLGESSKEVGGDDKGKQPAEDDEKLECLLDLDEDVLIEDWISDDEVNEIEIETDLKEDKYERLKVLR